MDRNQSESVGQNKHSEVGNNFHEYIGGDHSITIGPGPLTGMVQTGVSAFTEMANDVANTAASSVYSVPGEGNYVVAVGNNKTETVMVSSSELVGGPKLLSTGGGYQLTVGGMHNTQVAMSAWEDVGQTKVILVGQEFELTCGKSSLVLDSDGNIELKGVNLTIEGDKIKIDGKSEVAIKSAAIKLN